MPLDDEVIATDEKVQEALSGIELSRQMLSVSWDGLVRRNHELQSLQKDHLLLHDSYKQLEQKQAQTLEHLEMAKADYKDLETDCNMMRKLVQEYQAVLSMDKETGRREDRVQELEEERAEMMDNHHNALVIAGNQISTIEHKLDEIRISESSPSEPGRGDCRQINSAGREGAGRRSSPSAEAGDMHSG